MDPSVCQVFFLDRKKTLSQERVARRSRDGCGARSRTKSVPPLIRRCGDTFPQGKVRDHTRYHRDSSRTFTNPIFSYRAMARSLVEATSSRRGTPGQTEAMVCSTYFPAPG